MSIPSFLNLTKCLKKNILVNVDKKRSYSLRKWDENNMFTVKNEEGKALGVSFSSGRNISYSSPSGNPGCGAGKGGGAGGTIRESGGGLGQYGTAQEERFFFDKQKEQLKEMKKKMLERKDLKQKTDK